MGSRIVASVVVVASLAALLWVTFGNRTSDESAVSVVSQAAAADESTVTGIKSSSTQGSEAQDDAPATSDDGPTPATTAVPAVAVPENFGPRMDLVEIDGWLNTDATSIDDFNGKVVLVEMWTFGCHNCKARIPFNQSYYEEFGGDNFEIVGVHAPEFSFEAEVPNIVEAIDRLGVTWPVALDTNKKNFRAWQPGSTNFWPRTYVIDQNGDIRYDHIGEGKYEELRETIRFLIENPPAANAAS